MEIFSTKHFQVRAPPTEHLHAEHVDEGVEARDGHRLQWPQLVEDEVTDGCLELGSILALCFPCFIVLGMLPTPVKLINFSLILCFDLQKRKT